MTLSLAPMTRSFAEAVAAWHYDAPYDLYDGDARTVEALMDGNHLAVVEDGGIVGFVGVGLEARVPGGPTDLDATDVGIGIAPDRVSEGLGARAGALAIEALALAGCTRLRVSILERNERSRRLASSLGFVETGSFTSAAGDDFVIAVREP